VRKLSARCDEAKRFSRPCVEFQRDGVEIGLTPRAARIAEVDFYIGGNGEPPVGGKFSSSIPGQRRH